MKSRVLITGAAGFAGRHLSRFLLKMGMEVWGLERPVPELEPLDGLTMLYADICDSTALGEAVAECQPDQVYHLAAQSSVGLSWERPAETIRTNLEGTVSLLETFRKQKMLSRILLVGSGEEYGPTEVAELPITEEKIPEPQNPYSLSKYFQTIVGMHYCSHYHLPIYFARTFNHIGPGQKLGFVVPDFAAQIARIEAGMQEAVINVGDLSAKRDFTDVRDVVRAYWHILNKGNPGRIYNVGSGRAVSIREILDRLLQLSASKIEVRVDPQKFRPVEVPIICACIDRISEETGWQPIIDLSETLDNTLSSWRIEATRR